jgi:hypothetical protein
VKTGCNLAEYSEEGYNLKKAVLPVVVVVMMMMIVSQTVQRRMIGKLVNNELETS